MGSFNWHDEETGWEVQGEETTQDPSETIQTGSRRLRVWAVLGGLLLAALVWAGWWQISSVEDELEKAVLESWQIIVSSEQGQDVELLLNQLSGRDADWIETQQQLLEIEKLTGRGALLPALTRLDPLDPPVAPEIVFNPDLTEAILSHSVRYKDGWGREITLIQDEVFRLGSDRWLYSPPGPEYWGDAAARTETKYSSRFAYSAPTRDIETVENIVDWFENRLDALCVDGYFEACLTLSTPQVELNFTPLINQEILAASGSGYELDQLEVTLPTPSLIGLPATEPDMQLLAEAYGEQFFERYLIVLMSYRGVAIDPFLNAVNQYAITQVNGMSPLNLSNYQTVQDGIDRIETAFRQNRVLGQDTNGIRQFMDIPVRSTFRIMVQYRMQTPGLTPQQLVESHLRNDSAPFFPEILLPADEWVDFRRFVETRAAIANS